MPLHFLSFFTCLQSSPNPHCFISRTYLYLYYSYVKSMVHQTGPLWNTIIQQLLLIIGWTVKNNYLMNCHEILYRIVWPPEDTADNTADFSDPLIFLLALLDQLFLCAGSNTFHSWSLKLYLNDCGDPLTFLPWHHDIFAFYWNITNGLTEIWNS